MADNFLNRLARNPYAPIDAASVTRIDEMGNGLDDWGNIIAHCSVFAPLNVLFAMFHVRAFPWLFH